MTGDETPVEPASTPGVAAPVRRQGAAAAARRARRIGGLGVPVARDSAAEQAAPEQAAPEQAAPEQAAPEQAAPQQAATDQGKASRPSPRAGAPEEPAEGTEAGRQAGPVRVIAVPEWLRWLPAALVSAAAIAMAVLLVVFSHGVWWAKPSSASVRDRVLAAAKTCMTAINTYKYTELDAYETKALGCTTGAFTADLRQAIRTIVKVKAPQLKASQTISVHDVGIESVSGNHWTVLVFAQVDLTSSTYPKGSQTPYAAEVELEQVGGKWLLSRETTLGGAAAGGSGAGTGASVQPSTGRSGSAPASPSGSAKPSGG